MGKNLFALWKVTGESGTMPDDITGLMSHNNVFKKTEIAKITKAFTNGSYSLALEYAWSRAIEALKTKLGVLSDAFILELLDRNKDSECVNIRDIEIVSLATDLGLLNKNAKWALLYVNEQIMHSLYEDDVEEMSETDAWNAIYNLSKHVLYVINERDLSEYLNFRNKLLSVRKTRAIQESLLNSVYFYKTITLRTIFGLLNEVKASERSIVLENMNVLVEYLWSVLSNDDQFYVGRKYVEALKNGDFELVSILKESFQRARRFGSVPEGLEPLIYIEYACKLIRAHYHHHDYFESEGIIAYKICQRGSRIPSRAMGKCITAILLSKMGNNFFIAEDAQKHLNKILDCFTDDDWEYYLELYLAFDEEVLFKLTQENTIRRWIVFVNERLFNINLDYMHDKNANALLRYSFENNVDEVKSVAIKMLEKIR